MRERNLVSLRCGHSQLLYARPTAAVVRDTDTQRARTGSEPFARPAHANDELDSAAAAPPATQRSCADNLVVRCEAYGSCPDVCDSDHKPVYATLRAEVPNVDVAKRRTHARRLLTELHAALNSRFVRALSLRAETSVPLPRWGRGVGGRLSRSGCRCHRVMLWSFVWQRSSLQLARGASCFRV